MFIYFKPMHSDWFWKGCFQYLESHIHYDPSPHLASWYPVTQTCAADMLAHLNFLPAQVFIIHILSEQHIHLLHINAILSTKVFMLTLCPWLNIFIILLLFFFCLNRLDTSHNLEASGKVLHLLCQWQLCEWLWTRPSLLWVSTFSVTNQELTFIFTEIKMETMGGTCGSLDAMCAAVTG